MAKYRTKYVGGPLDGQYYETDNLEDFGTTWSCMEAKDGSGRYYHWATRSDPTLDSVWESGKKRDWQLSREYSEDELESEALEDHIRRLIEAQDGQQG